MSGTGDEQNVGDDTHRRPLLDSPDANLRQLQLDAMAERIAQIEKRIEGHDLDIRKINSYSMRKNVMVNCVFEKKEVEAPNFDMKQQGMAFVNDVLLDGKNPLAEVDFTEIHPTKSVTGKYVQIVYEFRSVSIAKRVMENAYMCGPINTVRMNKAQEERERTGVFRKPHLIRVAWQLELVANSMMSYLHELKFRILKEKSTWTKANVNAFKRKNELNPVIYIHGKHYTVHDIPAEYINLMSGPWHVDWIKEKYAPKRNPNSGHRDANGEGEAGNHSGPSASNFTSPALSDAAAIKFRGSASASSPFNDMQPPKGKRNKKRGNSDDKGGHNGKRFVELSTKAAKFA